MKGFSLGPRPPQRLSNILLILSPWCPFFPMAFECYLQQIQPFQKAGCFQSAFAHLFGGRGSFCRACQASDICFQAEYTRSCINFMLFPTEASGQGLLRQHRRKQLTKCFWKNGGKLISFECILEALVFACCGIYVAFFSLLLKQNPPSSLSERQPAESRRYECRISLITDSLPEIQYYFLRTKPSQDLWFLHENASLQATQHELNQFYRETKPLNGLDLINVSTSMPMQCPFPII